MEAAKGKGRAVDFGDVNSDNSNSVEEISGINDVVAANPQLQPYKPNSQTIIVDCITNVEDSIELPKPLGFHQY